MVGLGKFGIPENCKVCSYSNNRYTFLPYWYCSHGCIYCYIEFGFRQIHAKRSTTPVSVDLLQAKKDYLKLKKYDEIEISSSCDAFDLVYERKYRITQRFLEDIVPLSDKPFLTLITKSNLLNEYIGLIPINRTVAQISIESYGNKLKLLSPKASSYEERKELVRNLIDNNVSTAIRIDPIMIHYTTIHDIEKIIDDLVNIGIKHITFSFAKLNQIQINRITQKLDIILDPFMYKRLKREYYFNDDLRREYSQLIIKKCNDYGLTYATCRETLFEDSGFCDPFHLLKDYKSNKENKKVEQKIEFKDLIEYT